MIKATQPFENIQFCSKKKNMKASLEDWNWAGTSDQTNEVADGADEPSVQEELEWHQITSSPALIVW